MLHMYAVYESNSTMEYILQTHRRPVTEYEAIREKVATQKRDIERALTRFIAKTGETHSLFLTEDNSMFPCKQIIARTPLMLNRIQTKL